MADLPAWLQVLINPQYQGGGFAMNPYSPDPSNPAVSSGLLGDLLPPQTGGLLVRPRPIPVDASVDSAADPNTSIRTAGPPMNLQASRSVDVGGANVVGTPASGTTEASSPGFVDKLTSVLGGLYGQGGPGDALISLGAGIASPEGWATGVQKSLAAQSGNALNNARLQAFKLQLANQQLGQSGTAAWLKSKGVDDATIVAAVNAAAAGNPELQNKLISQYAGGNKSVIATNPADNSTWAVNPYDATDKTKLFEGAPVKPFPMGQDPNTGVQTYGTIKDGKIVPVDASGSPVATDASSTPPSPATTPPPVDTSKPPQPGTPEAAAIKSRGEAFLDTLPGGKNGGFASQVRAVAEGREPYPVGTRSPGALALMRAVNQYDPFFDKTSTDARQKTRLDFAAGGPNSTAGVISAGNTGIQHLGHLSDWAEELSKTNTKLPAWNAIKNNAAINVGQGLPAMNFDTVAGLVSEELTKFYRGAGGNEADITRMINSLKSSSSPDQLRSTLKTITDLVGSKVNALQRQWHQGMGPLAEDYPILQPESQQVLGAINQRVQNVPGGTPGAASSESTPLPPPKFGDTRKGYRYIGGPDSNPGDPSSWQKIGASM